MDADVRVLTDDGEIFAKIERSFRSVMLAWRSGLHPAQRGTLATVPTLFSHAGADGAEELEQASFAEQVEVGCADAQRLIEWVARIETAGPVRPARPIR